MRRQLLFLTLALIIGASMSLFDIDRTGDDRANPAPNHSDSLAEGSVKAHKTISSHYTSDADSNTGRLQMLNKQVLANDGTTNKALFGYQQGLGLWGAFVAKPGVDVNTNTDPSQFVFNSSQNVFKIVQSGTVTIAYSSSNITGPGGRTLTIGSATVTHNLGYVPAVLCYANDIATQYKPIASGSVLGSSFSNTLIYSERIDIVVSTTTLIFNYIQDMAIFNGSSSGSTNGTQVVKYYLLQETAN